MKCLNFRLLLDEHLDGTLHAEAAEQCRDHVAACAACAARYEDSLHFLRALRTLEAPEPDPDFADRVFAHAFATHPRAEAANSWSWSGLSALAAGLMLAVGVGLWNTQESLPEVTAGGAEPVRLVFRSESALDGVTIELSLPEGVELAGYPGERRLVWQSSLRAGENLLELPMLSRGKGGVVTATVNHGVESRRFSVRVVAAPQPDTVPVGLAPQHQRVRAHDEQSLAVQERGHV